jgi:hypothetical protein
LSAIGLTVDGTRAVARSEYPEVLARMRAARLAALGDSDDDGPEQLGQAPFESLHQAEAFLSDPFARLAVGRMPGRSRAGERADFGAARRLVDAKALGALRRVLRGPNPEGRGFAAVGLSSLDALSPEDLRVIEVLKGTSTVVSRNGCMAHVTPAREFYENLNAWRWLFDG